MCRRIWAFDCNFDNNLALSSLSSLSSLSGRSPVCVSSGSTTTSATGRTLGSGRSASTGATRTASAGLWSHPTASRRHRRGAKTRAWTRDLGGCNMAWHCGRRRVLRSSVWPWGRFSGRHCVLFFVSLCLCLVRAYCSVSAVTCRFRLSVVAFVVATRRRGR